MYQMLNNRILLRKIKSEMKTKSGIIVTTDESEERTCQCEVISVCSESKTIKAGDIVIADKYKLVAIPVDMFFCNEDDLLAIVTD